MSSSGWVWADGTATHPDKSGVVLRAHVSGTLGWRAVVERNGVRTGVWIGLDSEADARKWAEEQSCR